MHVYKSLVSPSVVTHSISCNFTGTDNLVVIKGASLLQIFKTVRVQTHVFSDESPENGNDPNGVQLGQQSDMGASEGIRVLDGDDTFLDTGMTLEAAREEYTTKLVLESEWPLDGQVTGICAIRTIANPKFDSLLISFRYAKMVVVTWDRVAHCLSTASLHYYEKELQDSVFLDKTFTSALRVDPHGACASLTIQQDSIAFLPFVQSELLDDSASMPSTVNGNQNSQSTQLPPFYSSSFVLSASVLNASISNIIDVCFLYEYREPTIAIIYEPTRTWAGTIPLHKDTVRYLVLSLDLQQRSSTAIVSAQSLPYDVRKLIPVREPIGGCLLVGVNELIHIDSQGRQHGVSLNSFSSIVTENKFVDQNSLELNLDGCQITNLAGVEDEMLLITAAGQLFSIKFQIESRKVQGFKLKPTLDKSIKVFSPTSVAIIGPRHIFVGSCTSDSKLLQWKRRGEKTADDNNKTAITYSNKAKVIDSTHDELDDIYGDDDGGNSDEVSKNSTALNGQPIVYNVSDVLKSYGPIHDLVIGKAQKENKLNVVAATGYGSDMSLSIFNQRIYPKNFSDLTLQQSHSRIWTLNPSGISSTGNNDDDSEEIAFDSYMIASNDASSSIYKIEHEFSDFTKELSDFVSFEPTYAAQTMMQGQVVAQVHKTGITLFDADWTKLCVHKVKAIPRSASFADDFITVVFQDDASIIFRVLKNGDNWSIVERQLPKDSAVISFMYSAVSQALAPLSNTLDKKPLKRKRDDDPVSDENTITRTPVEFLVSRKTSNNPGSISMFFLNNISAVYDLSCLGQLPRYAVLEGTTFTTAEEKIDQDTAVISTIQHFYLSNDSEREEYLALKTDEDHIYFYHIRSHDSKYYLLKVQHATSLGCLFSSTLLDEDDKMIGEKTPIELIPFRNIDGFGGLFITGSCPLMLMKEAHGPVSLHKVASTNPIVGFSTFNTTSVYQGFAYLDSLFTFQIAKLPSDTDFGVAWPARRVNLGTPVTSLCYHESSDVYVVATSEEVPYVAADEDGQPIPGALDDMPKASNFRSTIKLVSPRTWTVIDEFQLQEFETVMTLKSVTLRVSDKNQRKKNFIVFGTSIMRGEDLAAKGGFYIYEAIEVVPEPGKPETSHKLKLVASEVAKGAVTSLCEVSGDLLIAQAQKVCFNEIYFVFFFFVFFLLSNFCIRWLFEISKKTIRFLRWHFWI